MPESDTQFFLSGPADCAARIAIVAMSPERACDPGLYAQSTASIVMDPLLRAVRGIAPHHFECERAAVHWDVRQARLAQRIGRTSKSGPRYRRRGGAYGRRLPVVLPATGRSTQSALPTCMAGITGRVRHAKAAATAQPSRAGGRAAEPARA
jgi:hypothetical protein